MGMGVLWLGLGLLGLGLAVAVGLLVLLGLALGVESRSALGCWSPGQALSSCCWASLSCSC